MTEPRDIEDIRAELETWYLGQLTHPRDPETGLPVVDEEADEAWAAAAADAVLRLMASDDSRVFELLLEANASMALERARARTGGPIPEGSPF